MCQELKKELKQGHLHALALCQHLSNMGGAAKVSIPIEIDGSEFMVTAELLGCKPESIWLSERGYEGDNHE